MTWPKQDAASMNRFFGPVGENQTRLLLPYNMVLTWDTSKKLSQITCHEKVAPALKRIFTRTLETYGTENISRLHLDRFSGCLNVRKMRGGSAWSIHSWGAAVDIDDERNQLRWGRDRAALARPEYDPFWKIIEEEDAVSLGRARNFDWQHFQFANL